MNRIIPARFNWIDLLAVPIAASAMEAQPIAAAIFVCSLVLTGGLNAFPFGPGTIFLLILGLRWWMRFAKWFGERGQQGPRVRLLFAFGLAASFALIIATHLALLDNLPALSLTGILVIALWWLNLQRLRTGRQDEQLLRSFKAGLLILLVVLLCALDPVYSILLNTLIYALPIFFLSSLVAFSFNRLSSIKEEYLRHPMQADPTRPWSLLLLSLSIMLVSILFALEFPILQFFSLIFSPLRNPLMAFFGWLAALFNVIPEPPVRSRKPIPRIPPGHVIAPTHVGIWVAVIGFLLIFAICVAVIIIVLRAWYAGYRNRRDELHKAVSVRAVLRERRRKRQRAREAALDPASARAHYRAFLRAMTQRGQHLARQPDETPLEYQTRLIASSETAPEQSARDTPPALLEGLTSAYVLERYGGKRSRPGRYSAARNWLAELVRHFG